MPLTNNASYLPAMNEFLAHWGQVDAALTPDLVVMAPDKTAVGLADFTVLRKTLQGQFQAVIDCLNDKQIARGDIELRKAGLLLKFNEFTGLLDGYWGGTAFINARPYAPSVSDGQEVFLAPMQDMLSLWGKLNAAAAPVGVTLPLELAGGMLVAGFAAEVAGLQAAYLKEAQAKQDAVLARSMRDLTKAKVRAVMITYRTVVPARCALHPALVATLPAVTPPPGHTPKPVTASAVYQAPDAVKVVYAASDEALLARYELRGNPGDECSDEDSVVIMSHTAAGHGSLWRASA